MFQTEDKYLSLRNLTVRYGALEAVKSVSLEVPAGKVVSLLGANGSGKSTILKAISGLKKPARGEIWFQGSRIDRVPPYAILRRGIVHVPEGRGLFPYMTIFENLQMGAFSLITHNQTLNVYKYMFDLLGFRFCFVLPYSGYISPAATWICSMCLVITLVHSFNLFLHIN